SPGSQCFSDSSRRPRHRRARMSPSRLACRARSSLPPRLRHMGGTGSRVTTSGRASAIDGYRVTGFGHRMAGAAGATTDGNAGAGSAIAATGIAIAIVTTIAATGTMTASIATTIETIVTTTAE